MNYVPKLLRFLRENPEIVEDGKLSEVEIQHDDWCDLLAGTGPCNCDPTIAGAKELDWPEED